MKSGYYPHTLTPVKHLQKYPPGYKYILLYIFAMLCYSAVFLFTVSAAAALGEDSSSSGSITLIGQSPWITDDKTLSIDLRVSGSPDGRAITLQLHKAMTASNILTNSEFTNGASDLTAEASETVTIQLEGQLSDSGIISLESNLNLQKSLDTQPASVHPLSILLTETNGEILDQIETKIIHLPKIEKGLPLLTGILLEVVAPPPLMPDSSTSIDTKTLKTLNSVTETLSSHPLIPIDLRLPPATIAALARSTEPSHLALLQDLASVVGGSIRIGSTPFVTADPEAWRQAGRTDIYRDLVDHGDLALLDHLGKTPDRSIVHLRPTAIAETLDLLSLYGSQRFIISADHLDPRPTNSGELTRPVRIRGAGGSPFSALVTDPQLDRQLLGQYGPVATVQDLLATLAIRAWDEPLVPRISVISIGEEAGSNPLFLDIFFAAIKAAPFIDLAPLPSIFASINNLESELMNELVLWPEPVITVTEKVRDRGLVEVTIEAYEALLGGSRPEVTHLEDLLETTVATEITPEEGAPYHRAVYEEVLLILDAFEAPTNQNVRLTSRRATVPYTVENQLNSPVRVALHLESDGRLDFPEGNILEVTLKPGNNRIPIPVNSKTSGDARLQVTVRSPDDNGLLQLQSSLLLVRSTQLSGVGVLLLASALLVLGVWWFRTTHLERRKKSGAAGD